MNNSENPLFEQGFKLGQEAEARHMEEVVEHEIEEWSRKIEEAKTPEERKDIITAILAISESDRLREAALGSTREELNQLINKIREKFGLPPKYA